jgi:uncharacterized repeat protein (TIGR01451 family)
MKIRIRLLALLFATPLWAAAPNDITTGQRVWFDGLDTTGVGYSSTVTVPPNPANAAIFSSWVSKVNGYTANVAIAGTSAPTYGITTLGIGASFPGGGAKALSVTGDIWGANGTTVPIFEQFVITSSSNPANQGFLFGSEIAGNSSNRLTSHFAWGNTIYLDPTCCIANRSVAWTLATNQLYLTNWLASVPANNKKIIINATNTVLNANTVGTYTQNANSFYSLGYGEGSSHAGLISENIVYNQLLNDAQKRILNNYFSAKWGMSIGADDRYVGDTVANGLYRYHVAGIGQESTGSQTAASSEGLRITDAGFLGNGRYLLAGLPGLSAAGTMNAYDQATSAVLTAPKQLVGTVATNLPSNTAWRGNRVWYLDKTDASSAAGNVNLIFDVTGAMGISSFAAGDTIALLYRPTLAAAFQVLATQPYAASSTFVVSAININDGYYTVGKVALPKLYNSKTVTTISDPVNGASSPKNIPGSVARYTITVSNQGEGATDANTTIISDSIPANTDLFTGGLSAATPFTFTDGTPSSGLTCAFISLANTTDCIEFSNDGGVSWSYTPIATADYDPAVTNVRFKLVGSFSRAIAPLASPYPSFTLAFTARIK